MAGVNGRVVGGENRKTIHHADVEGRLICPGKIRQSEHLEQD